jgi:hypothetical protein
MNPVQCDIAATLLPPEAKDVTERIYRGFPGNQLPSDVRGDVGQLPPTV